MFSLGYPLLQGNWDLTTVTRGSAGVFILVYLSVVSQTRTVTMTIPVPRTIVWSASVSSRGWRSAAKRTKTATTRIPMLMTTANKLGVT